MAAQVGAVATMILLWQAAVAWWGLVDRSTLPTVPSTAAALLDEVRTPELWRNLGHTLSAWVAGVAIATVLAVPTGLAAGRLRWLGRVVNLPVDFLRTVPPVTLIPLLILTVGPSWRLSVALSSFAAFWIILVQTIHGAQSTPATVLDTAKTYRLTLMDRLWYVFLGASAPSIVTGLRLGAVVGLLVTLSSEVIAGSPGLGKQVMLAQISGDTPVMYATIIVVGLLGLGVNTGLARAERSLLSWHPAQQARP
ncbi:ABC transporter permease [Nocardioides sp. GXZ039]|uniref:ABC transporter permease n=1 Tax=Nocardioides sp. GXZ039 TaxID=3136018 RepID=UPI0030F4425E